MRASRRETQRYRGGVRVHRIAALVLPLALAGCSSSSKAPTINAGGTSTTTGVSSTGLTTSSLPAPVLVTPPVSAPESAERAYLRGVRAAASATPVGGSRVVFEFDPVVPGYVIDYIDRPVTEDASGREIAVEGNAVLQVRMVNAMGARFEGEKVIPTYTGPKRVIATGTGGVVTEVVDAGDFEGQVTWAVGLRQKVAGIAVTTLTGPSRLVIDVPAPAASTK